MKNVRTILPCILVVLLAVTCLAADEADSRLDKKVSIQSLGQPLGSFVTPLGMQTGVIVKADKGVADHKLVVLVKDLPLSQLLSGIADALHIQLRSSKGSDGTFTYEFYEEPESKQKADQLYNTARTGLRRQMDHAADILRLNLPPEELQKKIDADQLATPYIGDQSFRTAVEVYSKLSDKDRTRLWDIGNLPVELSKIPEATRKKIIAIFDENRKQREQSDNVKLTDTVASVLFDVQDDPLAGRSISFNIVGTGTHGMTYMFMQVEEGPIDLLGNDEYFELTENKESGEFQSKDKQIPEKLAKDSGVELPEDTLKQAVQKLYDTAGASIIADWYTPRYTAQAMVDKWAITRGDAVAHEIEKIAEVFMCKWKLSGDACIMSSKTWFEDRKVEIPISTIQKWQSDRQKSLGYSLPLLMEMALLGDKQHKTFRYYGMAVPDSFYPCVPALRFCSTLTPAERDQAMSAQGLDVSKLAEDQKLSLSHWILAPMGPDRKPSTFTEESAIGAKVRIIQNDLDWVFRAQTANGQAREDTLKLN